MERLQPEKNPFASRAVSERARARRMFKDLGNSIETGYIASNRIDETVRMHARLLELATSGGTLDSAELDRYAVLVLGIRDQIRVVSRTSTSPIGYLDKPLARRR